MQNQNLNAFLSPRQQFLRGNPPPPDFHLSQVGSTPQIPHFKDHASGLNSPYFVTANMSMVSEKSIRGVVRTQDSRLLRAMPDHPSKANSIVDNGDFRKDASSQRIDNKYGLEVRKIDRTPRNSHTEAEHKPASLRGNHAYLSPSDKHLLLEKRSIDYRTVQPEYTQTLANNTVGTPQPGLPKNMHSLQSLLVGQPNVVFQNVVVPKPSIKVEKEVVVQEFAERRREAQSDELRGRLKGVQQVAPEVVEIEIENVGVYEGTLRNNALHGFGRLFDAKQRLVFEGEFADNNFEGVGIQYNYAEDSQSKGQMALGMALPSNWVCFEGLFHNGLRSGMGSLYFADGSRFHGDFDSNAANGYGRYVRNNEVVRGAWRDNVHLPN